MDDVGPRQAADLAEVKDWVEGLRTAAHNARQRGNSVLAEALDIVRFEVYDSYLDEEYTNDTAKRLIPTHPAEGSAAPACYQ